ncbi:unnamed protein product [Didymodactylos carnosus]|uniref:TLDc domain-containing protein n=1 Tax=Didymodactylos carnosus TaxID=1234261 RepID=A0A8S2HIC9_9BILA|nr:unnamed protein product [Didymodactylos carnosus]CAF3645339.1 unnamed protein product [Didymodactylos carnosus]
MLALRMACSTDVCEIKELLKQRDGLNEVKPLISELRKQLKEIHSKLDKFNNYVKKLDALNEAAIIVKTNQEEIQTNLDIETKEWKETKKKLSAASILGKVTLNVGGDKFQTTEETLTKENDTFFTALFSQQWQLEKDEEGSIFIDRDGKLFAYILRYFRTGELELDDRSLRRDLITEAKFYSLKGLLGILTEARQDIMAKNQKDKIMELSQSQKLFDSYILMSNQQLKLDEFCGSSGRRWKLLFRGTRDGFTAKHFHRLCDRQKPTITVIQSKPQQWIFGGYTSIPWTSERSDKVDPHAFLFTLENPHGIPPTKYPVKEDCVRYAVRHSPSCGPTFGTVNSDGSDLCIFYGVDQSSCTYFPRAYLDLTGKAPDRSEVLSLEKYIRLAKAQLNRQ